jgi:hypothetical protein
MSKVLTSGNTSFLIKDKTGREVSIGFEATWQQGASQPPRLKEFTNHLR